MRAPILYLFLLLTLAACATSRQASVASTGSQAVAGSVPESSQPSAAGRLGGAAITPLNDLNLVRTKIPLVLSSAQKAPYAPPLERGCASLAAEVGDIDAVLGADLDSPPSPDHPSLIERGSDMAGDVAIGALKSAAGGLIPFRGWVRKLTGAERHSKEVAAAIAAGGIRRAYLKGLGQSLGCEPPAAPRSKPPETPEPAKPADR